MTEKQFVKYYVGRTKKRAIGIKDIETNRVYVTIEENIHLLNELADENKEIKEENEQSKMMISTLRNIVLEQEDLEKENKELKQKIEALKMEIAELKESEKDNYNITNGLG